MTEFKLTLTRIEADCQTTEVMCYHRSEYATLSARELMRMVDGVFDIAELTNQKLLVPILQSRKLIPIR